MPSKAIGSVVCYCSFNASSHCVHTWALFVETPLPSAPPPSLFDRLVNSPPAGTVS